VRYGFAARGAVLGSIPLAARCAPGEVVGFPGAPAGATGESFVTTAELTPLGGLTRTPPDVCVTYCGVRPFHQAPRPENQPRATGGCPFPSYAGEDMG